MGPFDFILHIDTYLQQIIDQLGSWTYVILFLIIFAETGLVVTPFLPGDSLLFAAGTLAASGYVDLWILLVTFFMAAVLGNSVNYWIGHKIGPRAFSNKNARFFKPGYLAQTEAFFAKHGGKTIILTRFVPIVRTFAPFVAGVGTMKHSTFMFYNVIGALLWTVALTLAGYFFGSIPLIKDNFEYMVFLIVFVSVVPAVIGYFRHRGQAETGHTSYSAIKKAVKKD
jgi:membrane-associated protein